MENSGTRKFREYQIFMEFKKKNSRKFQDFFFRGQKIPGFLAPLNSRIENSVTEFPRTFFCHLWAFLGKTKTKPCLSWAWPQNPEMGPLSYLHSGLLKSRRRVWILPYCIGDRGWVSTYYMDTKNLMKRYPTEQKCKFWAFLGKTKPKPCLSCTNNGRPDPMILKWATFLSTQQPDEV